MAARLIFFGNERLATGVTTTAPILRALVADGYEVAAVITAGGDSGKSRKARVVEIVEVARGYGIPVLSPASLEEAADDLGKFEAEVAVLVAYGNIVPKSVIDIFPKGIINIHPSLLPAHRGSAPIESVILRGEKQTGVSLMQLVEKMDAGPTFDRQKVTIRVNETKQALADKLSTVGKELLLAALPGILDGGLKPEPQDDFDATYDGRITKDVSELDFQKPAAQLEREVRAYAGWPRSRAMIGTSEVIVTEAHVLDQDGVAGTIRLPSKELAVHAGEGTLVLDKVIPAGKKEMTGQAYLAGYHL